VLQRGALLPDLLDQRLDAPGEQIIDTTSSADPSVDRIVALVAKTGQDSCARLLFIGPRNSPSRKSTSEVDDEVPR
jgi:hypothetical protein